MNLKADSFRFSPDAISASAGTIVFFIVNDNTDVASEIGHNVRIGVSLPPGEALASSREVRPGESALFTVTGLEPGTFQIWCSVHEHYALGMVGTLTVTP